MEESDKSEAATPYKLEQARSRGTVARSPEIAGAVVVLAAVIAFRAWNWETTRALFTDMRAVLSLPAATFGSAQGAWAAIQHAMLSVLRALAPFFAVIMVAAVAANVMQTGLVWSGFPLKPDLSRINPVSGFKRVFSLRTIYDAAKSLLKVAVLGTVLYFAARDAALALFTQPSQSAADGLRSLLSMLASLGLKIGIAAFLLACLDLLYSRHEFARKMPRA